jgi:pyruvate dehydrogenase E1 component alpha subunit
MIHTIVMPDLGQTTAEGKILRWLKGPGEKISQGDHLLEVETDKVTMEVESYLSGYLRQVLAAEGQMVSAMAPIAIVTDTLEEPLAPSEQKAVASMPAAKPVAAPPRAATTSPAGLLATPTAKALAKEWGIDLASVRGTGPDGLITRRDVEGENSRSLEHPMTETDLSKDQKLAMYRRMLLCRRFEERVYYMFLEGRLPGTVHQSAGQEASAVGVCSALVEGDMITSTHRPHSHAIARGLPVKSLMAELFAKTTGCCHGKGGSMHLGDYALGMLPAIAIVGGGIPLATGQALAFQYLGKKNIVACFFGDGAANIGTFHEAINMGAIWNLPVVYICENNKYGASTSIEKVMKVKHVAERAAAYGIPGETIDGNDVEGVYRTMSRAGERARAGAGPTLLELETYRFSGHSRSDPGRYRPSEEVAAWKLRDPVEVYEKALIAEGHLREEDASQIKASVEQELDEAVEYAEGSPDPAKEECLTDVFA